MHCVRRISAALFATCTLVAVPAVGQIRINARFTAAFASAYVDRGVVLTNQPVIRPKLGIRLPAGTGLVGFDVAAVVEPANLTGAKYFSMAPDTKRPNVTELHPSLQLSQPLGVMTFTFAAGYRMFPNGAGITKDANTGEVETGLTMTGVPFAPGIRLVYEVGGINGPYIEAHINPKLRFSPNVAFALGARAGVSIEQTVDTLVPAFAAFERSGLTHVDLSAGWEVLVAGAMINPYIQGTFVRHPYISPDGFERQRKRMVTVGISLSLVGTFPKAK